MQKIGKADGQRDVTVHRYILYVNYLRHVNHDDQVEQLKGVLQQWGLEQRDGLLDQRLDERTVVHRCRLVLIFFDQLRHLYREYHWTIS